MPYVLILIKELLTYLLERKTEVHAAVRIKLT